MPVEGFVFDAVRSRDCVIDAHWALHQVEMEDKAIMRAVQRGTASRFYGKGRYSPTREQGTHHFHRLLCEFMQGTAAHHSGPMMEVGES